MIGLGLNIANSSAMVKVIEPIMAANPAAWYNESTLSAYAVNDPVDTLTDSSGNEYHLSQIDSAKRPVAKLVDGKKTLYFTNDTLLNSNHPVLTGSDFTMIYVGAALSNYHTALYIGDDDTPDNTSSFRLGRSTDNQLRAIIGDGANGAFNTGYDFVSNGNRDIAYAYQRGTNSEDIRVGLDNGATVSEKNFGVSGLELSFGGGIGIGTNNPDDPALTGTGNFWYLFEVIVYDRGLTDLELAQTRKYLRQKWNV